jgi:hypothetical protein
MKRAGEMRDERHKLLAVQRPTYDFVVKALEAGELHVSQPTVVELGEQTAYGLRRDRPDFVKEYVLTLPAKQTITLPIWNSQRQTVLSSTYPEDRIVVHLHSTSPEAQPHSLSVKPYAYRAISLLGNDPARKVRRDTLENRTLVRQLAVTLEASSERASNIAARTPST